MADSAPIIHLASVTSTNDYLAQRWNRTGGTDLAPFTAVLADHQTKGRGRLARDWHAPRKTSLLMSVLIPMDPASLSWLPLLAGLAVRDALSALVPTEVDLKWPNDVLIGNRKIAGILSEYLGEGEGQAWVALGIGINLRQTPDELPAVPATSLQIEGARVPTATALAFSIVTALRERLASSQARTDYAAACISTTSEVRVNLPGGETIFGVGQGIDEVGGLLVLTSNNETVAIHAGDVVLIGTSPHTNFTPFPKELVSEQR